MKNKRFTEGRITGILNEPHPMGITRNVCGRNSITETTHCRWRIKFGGMEVSNAMQFRLLEHESA